MGLIDRLREAVPYIFRGQKAITGLPIGNDGVASYPKTDFETLSKDGYEKNAVVYACVNELASSASEANLIVEQRVKDGWEERPDHALKQLLDKPNPEMSGYEFLFELTMYDSIAGNMFYEKERSRAGRVVGLWPMWPQRVKIIAVPSKPGQRVKRSVQAYEWRSGADSVQLPAENVIHFKRPHPREKLWGFPPLAAAAREGDTDNSATDFVNSFFKNAGIPFGMFKVAGYIDPAERKRIEEAYLGMHSGKAQWHKPLILAEGTEWVSMADSFKDMDFPNLRQITETRICMVYQVPPIIIGAFSGLERSTFSNFQESQASFWLQTLTPHYRRIQDCLNLHLAPEFGRDIRVRFDFSGVKALQEEVKELWERVNAGVEKSWVLVSEARSMAGLEYMEGTDVFLRPLMLQAVVPGEEPQPAAPTELPGAKQLKSAQVSEEAKERWATSIRLTARAWRGRFEETALDLLQQDKAELAKILKREGKASKQAAPYRTFLDAGMTYLMVSKNGWRQAFLPLFTSLLGAQMENVLAAYGISWDIERPEVQQFLDGYTMEFAKGITGVTESALREMVATAQSEGWTVTQTRTALMNLTDAAGNPIFDKARAMKIARTETMRSSNYGTKMAWKDAGVTTISWHAYPDCCSWCAALDGETIAIESNFRDEGGEVEDADGKIMRVMYGDVGAPPLHPNCECVPLAVVE